MLNLLTSLLRSLVHRLKASIKEGAVKFGSSVNVQVLKKEGKEVLRMSKKIFNWYLFSELLQVVMSFGVKECSSCHYEDELEICVLNRPINNDIEEKQVRGTLHEKHIRLEWTADDMDSNYSWHKRDHEDMLRRLFKGYNMKASFNEPYWTLYLWVPQEDAVWKHTIEYISSDS